MTRKNVTRYAKNKNIIKIYENGTEKIRYTYDDLSRLIREDNKDLNKTLIFIYNKDGNIEKKIETNYSNKKLKNNTLLNKFSKTYNYSYTNAKKGPLLSTFDGEKFVYDNNGNPIICRDTKFLWDNKNLVKIGNYVTYKYNSTGMRTFKIFNNHKIKLFLDGNNVIAQDDNINKLKFYYDANGLISFSVNGNKYIYKKNINNDIIGIYDSSGKLLVKYVYDSLGNHKIFACYKNNFIDTSLADSPDDEIYKNNVKLATLNPFRFHSYYFDEETGLYYFNSHYYDPEIGRFINA